MTTRAAVDDFLSLRTLAVVGASRKGGKFGNVVLRELDAKGYEVVPVNPHAEEIGGRTCYADLAAVADQVEGAVLVVPPAETERVVREARDAGIRHVWMQQGAESEGAIRFCAENGMHAVHGECILMFAEPAGFLHRVHRWVWGVLGKLPEEDGG